MALVSALHANNKPWWNHLSISLLIIHVPAQMITTTRVTGVVTTCQSAPYLWVNRRKVTLMRKKRDCRSNPNFSDFFHCFFPELLLLHVIWMLSSLCLRWPFSITEIPSTPPTMYVVSKSSLLSLTDPYKSIVKILKMVAYVTFGVPSRS